VSAPAIPSTSTCRACGSRVPPAARFCPECGGRMAAPAHWLPPRYEPEPFRRFGSPPANALAWAAGALAVLAILILALVSWPVGVVLLVLAAMLFAVWLVRNDDPRLQGPLARVRTHGRAAVVSVAAQAQAQKDLLQLRRELQRAVDDRADLLRALGEAVYHGDDQGREWASAALRDVDAWIHAKEVEMAQVEERTYDRVGRARFEARQTELLEPPSPPPGGPEPYPQPVPEPYPPPDEGTPPTPAPVPEPYPPPDEGDPPRQI
jgi:hypothetical protein